MMASPQPPTVAMKMILRTMTKRFAALLRWYASPAAPMLTFGASAPTDVATGR